MEKGVGIGNKGIGSIIELLLLIFREKEDLQLINTSLTYGCIL
jgi:hypothetical protein